MMGLNSISPVLAAAAALALVAPALAQDEQPAPAGSIARASAYASVTKLPDWSGVWYPDWSAIFGPKGRPTGCAAFKLTPDAQAKCDAYEAGKKEGENQQLEDANCVPPGMPRIMQMPYPIEFLFSPGRVTLFTETYSQARRIYTDGEPLPTDPDPYFNGHSRGHWEGDTLVVDTVGFNPLTVISGGVPHSDQMTIHERIYLVNPDRLMDEITITDPKVLTQPFVIRQPFDRKAGWKIREYVCEENNRDSADTEGRAGLNLDLNGDSEDPFGPPVSDKGK
jgi:hypothetical protein